MPQVDTAYIVGVLREWEKGFLEDDEYTRLIEAPNATEAVHVLVDTPYGQWIDMQEGVTSVLSALERHLAEVKGWLDDHVDSEQLREFMSARYDGLNMATMLRHRQLDQEAPETLSPLGVIGRDVLQSVLWHDMGWEALPVFWQEHLRKELAHLEEDGVWERMALATKERMRSLAFTPLMRALVAEHDAMAQTAQEQRPLTESTEASAWDRQWDDAQLTVLREHRLAPLGYDPILAFWLGKELEVKNLRLLLSAKIAGMEPAAIRPLQRSLYRTLA